MPGRITITKQFTYRANSAELWSNTYCFQGDAPDNGIDWAALCDGVAVQERLLLHPGITIVSYLGYDSLDDSAHAVFSKPDVDADGEYTIENYIAPGDCAAWVRWPTSRLTSKGKRIYMRKYFHGVDVAAASPEDALANDYLTALQTYGATIAGSSSAALDGGFMMADRHGDPLLDDATYSTSLYVGHRDLKRRSSSN